MTQDLKNVFTCKCNIHENCHNTCKFLSKFDLFQSLQQIITLKLTSKVDSCRKPLQNCFNTYKYCDNISLVWKLKVFNLNTDYHFCFSHQILTYFQSQSQKLQLIRKPWLHYVNDYEQWKRSLVMKSIPLIPPKENGLPREEMGIA